MQNDLASKSPAGRREIAVYRLELAAYLLWCDKNDMSCVIQNDSKCICSVMIRNWMLIIWIHYGLNGVKCAYTLAYWNFKIPLKKRLFASLLWFASMKFNRPPGLWFRRQDFDNFIRKSTSFVTFRLMRWLGSWVPMVFWKNSKFSKIPNHSTAISKNGNAKSGSISTK